MMITRRAFLRSSVAAVAAVPVVMGTTATEGTTLSAADLLRFKEALELNDALKAEMDWHLYGTGVMQFRDGRWHHVPLQDLPPGLLS